MKPFPSLCIYLRLEKDTLLGNQDKGKNDFEMHFLKITEGVTS